MARSSLSLLASFLPLLGALGWLTGCAAALGPGYLVEQQEIHVDFSPAPRPTMRIRADYRLQNTGNQELDSLDVHLPGARFRPNSVQVTWDGEAVATHVSPDNSRDSEVRFPRLWKIGEIHTLSVSYEISAAADDASWGNVSADAFYLPAEGWTPRLPQARGLFGFGGVPPGQWQLVVTVPEGFLIHASGNHLKRMEKGDLVESHFTQTAEDLNPFVVAGRYAESQQTLARDRQVRLWTRGKLDPARLRDSGESLSRTLATYDELFGAPAKSRPTLWIVECPVPAGCIPQRENSYSALLYGAATPNAAELISRDSVVVDPRFAGATLETSAGPALAAGWLGYGQNPGFYEQRPPVSALPAFAAAQARGGNQGEIIQRALAAIPEPASTASNSDPAVTRAKSLLLFYALRDRVGAEAFEKALQHMLYARRRRGFDVSDLISALEEESHQPVGPFVRQWIKGPGVPAEFRNRYSQFASPQ